MTTTLRMTAPKRVRMDSMRKTALVAGVFYLITFISMPRPREACSVRSSCRHARMRRCTR